MALTYGQKQAQLTSELGRPPTRKEMSAAIAPAKTVTTTTGGLPTVEVGVQLPKNLMGG